MRRMDLWNEMDNLFDTIWRLKIFGRNIYLLEGSKGKELAQWRIPLTDMVKTDEEIKIR